MEATQLSSEIEAHADLARRLVSEVSKVLVGQETMLERLLTGLLAGGHILLEGVPGLAKTLAVRSLAQAIDTGFSASSSPPTCCRRT